MTNTETTTAKAIATVAADLQRYRYMTKRDAQDAAEAAVESLERNGFMSPDPV